MRYRSLFVVAVIQAAFGMASAQAQASAPPSWCAGLKEDRGSDRVKTATSPQSAPQHALFAILQGLCYPDEETAGSRDVLEAARQTWMKRLLLTEADWASDLIAWGNQSYSERMLTPDVAPHDDAPWSKAGPLEQWGLMTYRIGSGDPFRLQGGGLDYVADALALTHTGRLGYVSRCVSLGNRDDELFPVEWATCQPDIEQLDFAKVAAEVRGETGRKMTERMSVRFAAYAVQERLPMHAARVNRLKESDPGYKKLFELAEGARREWAERATARAALLSVVSAMDDARATKSRRAAEGCSARVWPHYAEAIGHIPAKRFENIRGDRNQAITFLDAAVGGVLQDPEAYLAANALVTCEGPTDWLRERLRDALQFWPGYRGPRTATVSAIQLAHIELDRRDAKLEVRQTRLTLAIDAMAFRPMTLGSGEGIIAAVKPQGETAVISFAHTSEMQDHCVARRQTNRLSRIDGNGNFIYETACTKWTRSRVDTTPAPVTVPKRYAGGLRPGLFVSIVGGSVEAAWAKSSSPVPVAAFGVALR